MIALGPSSVTFDDRIVQSEGGFVWWYLDLTNDRGDGIVAIWSFGLPFLPGYTSSARAGRAPPARQRPSLNICIYQDGNLENYLLQEYAPDDVQFDRNGDWTFGDTTIASTLNNGDRRVSLQLDCPIPGSDARLTGTIDADGPTAVMPDDRDHRSDSAPPNHEWRLLTAGARGSVDLECSQHTYAFSGRAYHDCNAGTQPFHALGIDYWVWGRIPTEDGGEKIYYALWPDKQNAGDGRQESPRVIGIDVRANGRVTLHDDLEIEFDGRRSTFGGMTWWERLELRSPDSSWLVIDYDTSVDSGPFYMRFLTRSPNHDSAHGTGEFIAPHRIDLARHRPLVNMRVDHRDRRNSMWLPLFSGPRSGRVRRLLTQWW